MGSDATAFVKLGHVYRRVNGVLSVITAEIPGTVFLVDQYGVNYQPSGRSGKPEWRLIEDLGFVGYGVSADLSPLVHEEEQDSDSTPVERSDRSEKISLVSGKTYITRNGEIVTLTEREFFRNRKAHFTDDKDRWYYSDGASMDRSSSMGDIVAEYTEPQSIIFPTNFPFNPDTIKDFKFNPQSSLLEGTNNFTIHRHDNKGVAFEPPIDPPSSKSADKSSAIQWPESESKKFLSVADISNIANWVEKIECVANNVGLAVEIRLSKLEEEK